MKKFEFDLEALLRVRRLQEQEAKLFLQEKLARLNEIDQQIVAAAEERGVEQRRMLESKRSRLESDDLRLRQRAINSLAAQVIELRRQRMEWVQGVQAAQEALRVARREVELVDRLRERRYDEYVSDVRKAEQAELDEVARRIHTTATAAEEEDASTWATDVSMSHERSLTHDIVEWPQFTSSESVERGRSS